MQIFSFKELTPVIDKTNFISPTSTVIGDVRFGTNANIWFGSVARGDVNYIEIGDNTNVQDLCMLHVTEEYKLTIGKNVSVGHSAILHGCTIGDGCLIGMGSKLLDGAVIGKNCLVAAGSIVPPNKTFEEGSFVMGAPARVVRKLTAEEIESISNHYKCYLDYAKEFNGPELVDISMNY